MIYPQMLHVRQTFEGPIVNDVPAAVRSELAGIGLDQRVRAGEQVAVTAGSRGVANIAVIVKAVVDFVRQLGAEPFVVPAMGSHGGATAEGQLQVLETYGITPETMGCPIKSNMDTVQVCESAEGVPIHFDRNAYDADHVIVCNRVKLHTDFAGKIQSGLMKMMLIGLGKHAGASIYHRAFRDYSFDQIAASVAQTVIEQCGIAAAVATVENGYEQTALIRALRPDDIAAHEPELLQMSRRWMARLPFDDIDVLIIDEIGKNISGTGLDTNVVGRKSNENKPTPGETPRIKKIVVRDLTEQTHGNATGIGVADYTVQRVLDKMDYAMTRVNCVTSGRTAVGMIPIHFSTDRETIDAALGTCGLTPPDRARVVWIRNTLDLQDIACAEAFLPEIRERSQLEVVGEAKTMRFSDDGELVELEGGW